MGNIPLPITVMGITLTTGGITLMTGTITSTGIPILIIIITTKAQMRGAFAFC